MHTITHLIIGITIVLIFGIPLMPALIFLFFVAVIDIDHVVEINIPRPAMKKEYLWNIFKFQEENYRSPQKSMHLSHTFELVILVFLLSLYNQLFFWVGAGILVHLATDAWGNVWNRNLGNAGGKDWIKYWFIIYYIKKGTIYNKENFRKIKNI